jgi:hypothetical protein
VENTRSYSWQHTFTLSEICIIINTYEKTKEKCKNFFHREEYDVSNTNKISDIKRTRVSKYNREYKLDYS